MTSLSEETARRAYCEARRMFLKKQIPIDTALEVYRLWMDQIEYLGSRAVAALCDREQDRLTGYVPPVGAPWWRNCE